MALALCTGSGVCSAGPAGPWRAPPGSAACVTVRARGPVVPRPGSQSGLRPRPRGDRAGAATVCLGLWDTCGDCAASCPLGGRHQPRTLVWQVTSHLGRLSAISGLGYVLRGGHHLSFAGEKLNDLKSSQWTQVLQLASEKQPMRPPQAPAWLLATSALCGSHCVLLDSHVEIRTSKRGLQPWEQPLQK